MTTTGRPSSRSTRPADRPGERRVEGRAALVGVTGEASWQFLDPSSKPRIVAALRLEFDAFVELVGPPEAWRTPTACEGWQTRDMVGHLVDATGSFLDGFDAARDGRSVQPVGFAEMATATDTAARSFRGVDREELLARLQRNCDRLFLEIDELSDGEWLGLAVQDRYSGPLPAAAIATGLLGGLAVHGWDVAVGAGRAHSLRADTADLLVPFVFAMWNATLDRARVDERIALGFRVSGRNGGDTWLRVDERGMHVERSAPDESSTVLECDAGTFVLLGYGRVDAGTVHGDPDAVTRFRRLFRSI